jgi:hypothetical protein
MEKRRARRKDREAPAEAVHRHWVHDQVCVGVRALPGHVCVDRVTQSHLRDFTGTSVYPPEWDSLAMCWTLGVVHWEEKTGPFKGWSKDERKTWFRGLLAEEHVRFDRQHPGLRPVATRAA